MLKKLSILLTITLIFLLCVPAYAQTSTNTLATASRLVTAGTKTPSYGWAGGQSYYLGAAMSTYVLENGNLSVSEDLYYPVYQNERMVGIITEIYADSSSPAYTFSPSFADKLAQKTNNGNASFVLVLSGRQVFLSVNGTSTELALYDVPLPSGMVDTTASQVQQAVNTLPTAMTQRYNPSEKQRLSIRETRDPGTSFSMLNVNITEQQLPGSNLCWAATGWCIGEFSMQKYNTYQTYATACQVAPNQTQTFEEALTHIKNKYGITMANKNRPLTKSEMEGEIDESQPFAMCWYYNSGLKEYGHMTTGCGYSQYPGYFEVGVMDSLTGGDLWISANSSGKYIQKMGNLTYEYTSAANR